VTVLEQGRLARQECCRHGQHHKDRQGLSGHARGRNHVRSESASGKHPTTTFSCDSRKCLSLDGIAIWSLACQTQQNLTTCPPKNSECQQLRADLTLVVEGIRIPVHRAVLFARCPSFRSMLTSGMRECAQKDLEIEDAEYKPFYALLQYVYSGCSSLIEPHIAIKVLKLADR